MQRGGMGQFRLPRPEGHINEGCLFLPLALVVGAHPIDCHSKLRNCSTFGRISQLRIPGQIPDEHHLVQICHSPNRSLGQALTKENVHRKTGQSSTLSGIRRK